jgi:hypothetical protein
MTATDASSGAAVMLSDADRSVVVAEAGELVVRGPLRHLGLRSHGGGDPEAELCVLAMPSKVQSSWTSSEGWW